MTSLCSHLPLISTALLGVALPYFHGGPSSTEVYSTLIALIILIIYIFIYLYINLCMIKIFYNSNHPDHPDCLVNSVNMDIGLVGGLECETALETYHHGQYPCFALLYHLLQLHML